MVTRKGRKAILAIVITAMLVLMPLSVLGYSKAAQSINRLPKALNDSGDRDLDAIRKAIVDRGAQWTAGETSVSRRAQEMRKGLCGLTDLPEVIEGAKAETSAYQPALDWRNVGGTDWTTSIKDQAACGSCWAFGAIAAMEAQNNIEEANPDIDLDLSEQDLLSCSPGSCNGWYLSRTLNWLKGQGTVDETCFPYRADDTIPCSDACPDWADRTWKIKEWGWVNPTEEDIKGYLLKAPLPTSMNVYTDFFYYKEGVYEHVSGRYEGGHLVTLVGWDDTNQCWICKNSWGPEWGEGGWFRIKYGECGIESGTAYLVDVYQARAPTISISTDEFRYEPGDQMLVSLGATNPGEEQAVSVHIGVEKPDGKTVWFINKPSVTLTAGFEYSTEKLLTVPSIPAGTYTWHAVLTNPRTGLILCEDSASWEMVLPNTPTGDITDVFDHLASALDFGK
ncbi:MAG: hypothetical protein EFT35_02825 [Methanophagales archaeon ANME-1-THS]|nr:MAG: hypothetical protein EFT35_02825 [Methanophagales archaeon ANME-1-THS]